MKKNQSPWIGEIKERDVYGVLASDIAVGVAVVGAGIAGVATAFFLLTKTNKKVLLLDGYKIARGATGHNAGQVVSYFERSFQSLVDEFGLEQAGRAQKSIEDAWLLLDEMYTTAGLDIPFSRFVGHAGLSTIEQIIRFLEDSRLRTVAGLPKETIRIADHSPLVADIPSQYEGLYDIVPHAEVLDILETKNTQYIAVVSYQKGCINSALFCEEIVRYLLNTFPLRCMVFEHTTIHKVILHETHALLDAGVHTVTADRVVLCTNGFENLRIIHEGGLAIDTAFHHNIEGVIGYMSGFLEKMSKPPTAISYLDIGANGAEDPYVYMTRRPYEYNNSKDYNLISIGGPEQGPINSMDYTRESLYPEEMEETIDAFVHKTLGYPKGEIEYSFVWHGLMGYTPNGIRRIGPEPKNKVLLYNLGCNGVGILPSVYGGKKITSFIEGENLPPSIFDPQ